MKKVLTIVFIVNSSLNFTFAQDKISKRATGGVCNSRAIYFPQPTYPNADGKISGLVNVQIKTDEDGNVKSALAVSGHSLLRIEAEKAALKAKLKPSIIQGVPIEINCVLVYKFNANEKGNIEDKKTIWVGILNKKAINIPICKGILHYPRIIKDQVVAVQILVDMSGNVIKAYSLTGHPLFRGGCENAARQAKFPPILVDGSAVNVQGLLIYKYKPSGEVKTDIADNDKDVVGLPIDLEKPASPFCNCKFGSNPTAIVVADIDEQGNVSKAQAVSGHPLLRISSEKAAIKSKFLPTNIKTIVFIVYKFKAVNENSVKISDIEVKSQ